MNCNQYTDTFKRMNFLYFEMLGNLRGNKHHIEDNLRWLSGNINFIYFVGDIEIAELVKRMKDGEIPNILNLEYGNERLDDFMATGLFNKEVTMCFAERDAVQRGKTIGVRYSYPIAIGACERVGYKVCGETVTLTLEE